MANKNKIKLNSFAFIFMINRFKRFQKSRFMYKFVKDRGKTNHSRIINRLVLCHIHILITLKGK